MMLSNPGLISAFSKRPQNMSLNHAKVKDSLDNRRDFLNKLDIDYQDLVCTRQVHGSRVKSVEEKDRGSGATSYDNAIADTDALITNKENLPLAIFTADCLPVFLYDHYSRTIGLIHAGWRGTKDKITAKTIGLMQEEFNIQPAHLRAGFGPAIRGCCYEVGEDFNNYFTYGITERSSRYYLDLIEINKRQLLESGVKEKNIIDSKDCTFCRNSDFFSSRKEGAGCGRMMSVMMLKEAG